MSSVTEHFGFSRLIDLVEGRLSADERAEIEAHLAACTSCASEAAWLDRVIGLMRTRTDEGPPAHVVAAAKRLLQPRAPPIDPGRRQLTAMLQFDSVRAAAAGMRAGIAAERQMLFAAAGFLLDLRITPSGAEWVISGQLLGAEHCDRVELHGPAGTVPAMLTSLCEFTLPPTPPGHYSLIVRVSDLDIRIGGIEFYSYERGS